jgi:hypothetical protein
MPRSFGPGGLASQFLQRRPCQGQALCTSGTEVDHGLGTVPDPGDIQDHPFAKRWVGDVIADAQAKIIPMGGGDVLLTMPVLQDKAWFIHAQMGRVRACTADGASVSGDRPGPRCSDWSE